MINGRTEGGVGLAVPLGVATAVRDDVAVVLGVGILV